MKKRRFERKLQLNLETVRDLQSRTLTEVAGARPTLTECSNPCPCDGSDGVTEVTCYSGCGCGSIGC